ncbi:MAG: hypothetical protein ACKVYV_02505 [Limisphaerales bacterium]
MKRTLVTSTLMTLLSARALGCGVDFFLCDPARVPENLETLSLTSFRWERFGADSEFELQTGIVHPFHKRIAFDGYFSAGDDGDGWHAETIVPGLLLDLTPDLEASRFRLGIFTAYKFAFQDDEDATYLSATQFDARDQWESRFIVETDLTKKLRLVGNVLNVVYEGRVAWGYAAGARYLLQEELSLGVEAIGDFDSDGRQQVFGTAAYEPVEDVVVRLALGAGLSERAPDFALVAAFTFGF